MYAATPSHAGDATIMRVVQVPDVDNVRITRDGEDFTAWRSAGPNTIELDLTIGEHALVVGTGYHGRGAQASPKLAASVPAAVATATGPANAGRPGVAPSPAAIAMVSSCRCC